jgi:2-polyprenyl-6-methoxyphenol hydroxylase-like FAD-dependent oxidoreductase
LGVLPPVDARELSTFLTDRDGVARAEFLPPGTMSARQEAQLKARVGALLPPYHFGIVAASKNTFAHAISTVSPARYRSGRLCLVGDAGAVVHPFTTSGVFKGMRNAFELMNALAETDDIERALDGWDQRQRRTGERLQQLGDIMERILVTHVPDFAAMTSDALLAWWDETPRALNDTMR